MQKKVTIFGFSLTEMVIMTIIAAIFIMLSIATFFHYKLRFYYQKEIVAIAKQYQVTVTGCIKNNKGRLSVCDAGSEGIPHKLNSHANKKITVTIENGVIRIIPNPNHTIPVSHNYVLTPIYQNNQVKWTASGGGCQAGMAANC